MLLHYQTCTLRNLWDCTVAVVHGSGTRFRAGGMSSLASAFAGNTHQLSVLEFINTEAAYTQYLRTLNDSVFVEDFRSLAGQTFGTKSSFGRPLVTTFSQLLDWWAALLRLHEDLDVELQELCVHDLRASKPSLLPNSQQNLLLALIKRAPYFKAYAEYCRLHPIALEVIKEERARCHQFNNLVSRLETNKDGNALTLNDYLIKPVQRICKYPLLLRELKRQSEKLGRVNDANLEKAIKIVDEAVEAVNASAHVREETDELISIQASLRPRKFINLFLNLVRTHRKLNLRFDAKVLRITPSNKRANAPNTKQGNTKSTERLTPVSHMEAETLHVIVLTDLLLFTRRVVKPITLFRRSEKVRFHIAEIVSLRDGSISSIIPPHIETKGFVKASTLVFKSMSGDAWCFDVGPKLSIARVSNEIGKNIKEHTSAVKAQTEMSTRLKTRVGANLDELVMARPKRNSPPQVDRSGKPNRRKKSSLPLSSSEDTVKLLCPECNGLLTAPAGKTVIKCYYAACKANFLARYIPDREMCVGETIKHHGLVEWKKKTVYLLLSVCPDSKNGFLRWFSNQKMMVNHGISKSIGSIEVTKFLFVRHEMDPSSRNKSAFIVKQRDRKGLVETFVALNSPERDSWVSSLISVIQEVGKTQSGSTNDDSDLLGGPLSSSDQRANALCRNLETMTVEDLYKT